MKYLEIKDNKGYYWNGKSQVEIDKISKDDLLTLLSFAEKDDFEMDKYSEDLLENKAHQLIYENIYNKFSQFLDDKTQFKKEADSLYKDAISEYSVKVKAEDADDNDVFEDKESKDDVDPDDIPF